jgi:hypothetical protein
MTHIAIDTCVFEHYLNLAPEWNHDHHIDQLLSALQRKKVCLCLDSNNRIAGEYELKIKPIIRSRDESGIERFVLSYWMLYCPRDVVPTDESDERMTIIRKVICEKEPVDQAFVYVACARDCKLVTNDDAHILSRRSQLRKDTKRHRGQNSDFISSRQAAADLVPPAEAHI